MPSKTHKIKNGPEVMLFDFGGVDVMCGDGKWRSIATNPQACAELARLVALAADGKIDDEPKTEG